MDAIDEILDVIEGPEFTDDPADSGGPTRWGITQATLSARRGYQVTAQEVAELERSEARQIYEDEFFYGPRIHLLEPASAMIAWEVCDTGVNIGPGPAITILQRLLNGLNDRGRLYPDIIADGICGQQTAGALAEFLRIRRAEGERVLFTMLNCLQGAYYLRLAERREKDERFLYGWARARVFQQLAEKLGAS